MDDEFKDAIDSIRDMVAGYEARYEEIERARAKIYRKLDIPANISWGGFEYYETDIFNSDAAVDPKEFFRFFWKNDPDVTFDAQIALNGEKYLRPGRYDSGLPPFGKNSSREEDIEYLSRCAHEVLAVAQAAGCKNVELNPALFNEEEKRIQAADRKNHKDRTLAKLLDNLEDLGGFLGYQGPPISYVQLSANADTLRALAMLESVASIQLIRWPSNVPLRKSAQAEYTDELRNQLLRDDKPSLDPAP